VFRSASGDVAAAIGERVHEFNQTVHEQFRTRAWPVRRRFTIDLARRDRNRLVSFLGDSREAVNAGNWRSYTVRWTRPSRARSRPHRSPPAVT
jgi:hypothetical protein